MSLADVVIDCCNDSCRAIDILMAGKIEDTDAILKNTENPITEYNVISQCPLGRQFSFHIKKHNGKTSIKMEDEDMNVHKLV